MAEIVNLVLQKQVVPALMELAKLSLPIDGAMLALKAVRTISEHLDIVEQLREDTLKRFVELDDNDDFITRVDDGGKKTNEVIFKSEEDKAKFVEFLAELMQKTFECDVAFESKHFEDKSHPWKGTPQLLLRLGALVKD